MSDKKIGGLAQFLNQATVDNAQQAAQAANVVMIDIDKLVPDPFNMYGLREVESLAGMIASNNFHLEAIEVRPMEDGQYMIISGHRRRAAWEMLLKDGTTKKRELPCIIRKFEDIHIQVENDGVTEDKVITAENQANIALILANRGQRKEKTIEEEMWEIQELEPYVKLWYKQIGKPHERGHFKSFFASVLNISPSVLQKTKNLLRLIPRAKCALSDREINKSVALELSGLPKDEQDMVLDMIFSGELENSFKAMLDYKRQRRREDSGDEDEQKEEDTEDIGFDGGDDEKGDFPGFSPLDEVEEDTEIHEEEAPAGETAPASIQEAARDMGYAEPMSPAPAMPQEERPEDEGEAEPPGKQQNDIPEPPNTGNPQSDAHKWFLALVQPEIDRLEKVMEQCIERKKFFEQSDKPGAALKAARWDTCRSYLAMKILMLKNKD